MSKLEAQRAMRAARYDAARAASSARPSPTPGPAVAGAGPVPATRAARPRSKPEAATTASDLPGAELCGHRSSIGGKACRRPADHTETTHRYT